MIGSFYQPKMVLADLNTLDSLLNVNGYPDWQR